MHASGTVSLPSRCEVLITSPTSFYFTSTRHENMCDRHHREHLPFLQKLENVPAKAPGEHVHSEVNPSWLGLLPAINPATVGYDRGAPNSLDHCTHTRGGVG